MILPFLIPHLSDEERLRVLNISQKAEIAAQKELIEKLKIRLEEKLKNDGNALL